MNRRNFFRKLFVGVAAIAVAPKIIAEVTKTETALERGTRIHMQLEKYILGVDPIFPGNIYVYGTGDPLNYDSSSVEFMKNFWHEPNYLDRYKFIQAKSRRKGFGYDTNQFLPYYEESSMFPEIKL